jgi:mannose-1-phosphate guanylyltransferase
VSCDAGADVFITILAGGSGTRLWPLSRRTAPKQLLPLLGDRSLLQATYSRVAPLVPADHIFVLTGPDQADLVAEQLPQLPQANIFVEPSPRHTGPALGLAAVRLANRVGTKAVMVSVHADHVVLDERAFRRAVWAAALAARRDTLVTVGIVPSYAETGFGYVQRGAALEPSHGCEIYEVARFTEKPGHELASAFVQSGEYYWNTGYFAWTLEAILREFARQLPALYAQLQQVGAAQSPLELQAQAVWSQIRPVSIDVGIMEHAERVAVVPADMGWSDVGSWAAIYEVSAKDDMGNVRIGGGPQLNVDSRNTLVHATAGRMVATVGVQDLVIVDTGDALLVLARDRAQDVARIVEQLRAEGPQELL